MSTLLKGRIKSTLVDALDYEWTLQGFGMLRLYLPGGQRLHVWSKRHKVQNVSEIHTHPWNFRSTIVAGCLRNHIYRVGGIPSCSGEWMYEQKIRCGEGGGLTGERERKYLYLETLDIFHEGDTYEQRYDEIHLSEPYDGCVTLVERVVPEGNSPDHACVYYPVGTEWVSAEPRPATEQEILEITRNALKKNFLWG